MRLVGVVAVLLVGCLPSFEARECYTPADCPEAACVDGRCAAGADASTPDEGAADFATRRDATADGGVADSGLDVGTSTGCGVRWSRVIASHPSPLAPRLALGEGAIGIAASVFEGDRTQARFSRMALDGRPLDAQMLRFHPATTSTGAEYNDPHVVFAGGAYHLLFVERAGGEDHLRYARVDSNGVTISVPMRPAGDPRIPADIGDFAPAATGLHALWWERAGEALYLTTLDLSGAVQGPHRPVTQGRGARLASRAGELGFVFYSWVEALQAQNLFLRRTDLDLFEIDRVAVTSTTGVVVESDLVSDDGGYAIVYSILGASSREIWFERRPIDSGPTIPPRRLAHVARLASVPTLAWAPEQHRYAIAYQSMPSAGVSSIHATVLDAAGAVEIETRLSAAGSAPTTLWTGEAFVFAWAAPGDGFRGAEVRCP